MKNSSSLYWLTDQSSIFPMKPIKLPNNIHPFRFEFVGDLKNLKQKWKICKQLFSPKVIIVIKSTLYNFSSYWMSEMLLRIGLRPYHSILPSSSPSSSSSWTKLVLLSVLYRPATHPPSRNSSKGDFKCKPKHSRGVYLA